MSKRITKQRLAQMQVRKEVLIVDVRSPEHFRNSSIDGSVNLYPSRKFVNQLQHIQNKKQPIVIVSTEVTDEDVLTGTMYAERLGFENVSVAEFADLRD